MDKKLSCECRPPAAAPELAVPEAGRGRGERAAGTPPLLFLTPAALLTAPCPGEPRVAAAGLVVLLSGDQTTQSGP